jgi:hypothetical protein
MAPQPFTGNDFDLDIRVVPPDGPQPVSASTRTEKCTPRYGYYSCAPLCLTLDRCATIFACGTETWRAPRCA